MVEQGEAGCSRLAESEEQDGAGVGAQGAEDSARGGEKGEVGWEKGEVGCTHPAEQAE